MFERLNMTELTGRVAIAPIALFCAGSVLVAGSLVSLAGSGGGSPLLIICAAALALALAGGAARLFFRPRRDDGHRAPQSLSGGRPAVLCDENGRLAGMTEAFGPAVRPGG